MQPFLFLCAVFQSDVETGGVWTRTVVSRLDITWRHISDFRSLKLFPSVHLEISCDYPSIQNAGFHKSYRTCTPQTSVACPFNLNRRTFTLVSSRSGLPLLCREESFNRRRVSRDTFGPVRKEQYSNGRYCCALNNANKFPRCGGRLKGPCRQHTSFN